MTVEQVGWLLLILAVLLFIILFISSSRADRQNRKFLNRVKGRKRK